MKTTEQRIADLENLIKKQTQTLSTLLRKVSLLEKENSRRRNDIQTANSRIEQVVKNVR